MSRVPDRRTIVGITGPAVRGGRQPLARRQGVLGMAQDRDRSTGQDPQAPGDYGYDLAHEDTGRAPAPRRTPAPDHPSASPSADRSDEGRDFGYDEAHGF